MPFVFDSRSPSLVRFWQKPFTLMLLGLLLTVASVNRAHAAPVPQDTGGTAEKATPAEPFDHPIVPGYERIHAAPASTPPAGDKLDGGLLLLGELNCTSCHLPAKAWKERIETKTVPVLDRVGSRVRLDYLRSFLANPQHVKPGTTMPNLFASLPPQEAAAQVEALVHFFATTGGVHEDQPKGGADKRGERLFHTIGCVACHAPRKAGATAVTVAVPLGDLSVKYSLASLAEFLADPLQTRPAGRMPALNLKKEEAADLAAYFLQTGSLPELAAKNPQIKYASYEGNWAKLPDFNSLKPVHSGTVKGLDLSVALCPNNYGLRFEGFLHIPRDGDYTFHVGSDDGSRVVIDGQTAAISDGAHPFQWAEGNRHLTTGPHPITIEYYQAGGGDELQAEFEGPLLPRQPVLNFVTMEKDAPPASAVAAAKSQDFVLDVDLAKQGKELFAKIGCASCHQLKHGPQTVASSLKAMPLGELNAKAGCLSEAAGPGRPHYGLNARQRESLSAAVAVSAKPNAPELAAQDAVHRTLTTFNCYACHARSGVGGVEEARNDYFETTQKEMGDEGRLPPSLNGVGDKMNLDYIRRIFNSGGEDRPYMLTRMPKFGLPHLSKLAETLAKLDVKDAAGPPVELSGQKSRNKSDARMLVGERGLGCIKCHDFGMLPSTGIRAMSLTKLTQRLRHDWFDRYLLDPQSLRPGTRMPAAWPNGLTFFKNVLGGDPRLQIEGVWLYLSDGERAQPPAGLTPKSMEVVAEKEPAIYRNFIEGAGARAIGVGYPEKANLAFDAENLRLALLWHGAFIDASRHWTGRGAGYQPPAGDHVLPLTKLTPLTVLADPQAAWPETPAREQGYQFQGYRLGKDRRPTFRYRFQNVQIADTATPLPVDGKPNEPGLKRTLQFTSPTATDNLWFLAAQGTTIEPLADGRFQIDAEWKLRLNCDDPAAKPIVRHSGDKYQLLLPIRFVGNRATITQEFEW